MMESIPCPRRHDTAWQFHEDHLTDDASRFLGVLMFGKKSLRIGQRKTAACFEHRKGRGMVELLVGTGVNVPGDVLVP